LCLFLSENIVILLYQPAEKVILLFYAKVVLVLLKRVPLFALFRMIFNDNFNPHKNIFFAFIVFLTFLGLT